MSKPSLVAPAVGNDEAVLKGMALGFGIGFVPGFLVSLIALSGLSIRKRENPLANR